MINKFKKFIKYKIIPLHNFKHLIIKENNKVFQHNELVAVNLESYLYVYFYKKQLLENITLLLNSLNIKFVISHGNLIEWLRAKPNFNDDDVDIRFDSKDLHKWESFCSNKNNNPKFNLIFDSRFDSINSQKFNGIQARLFDTSTLSGIKIFNEMDIHLDLVMNTIDQSPWIKYDIDFDKIRKVPFHLFETLHHNLPTIYVPSIEDTHYILKKEYGSFYLIPSRKNILLKENFEKLLTTIPSIIQI